MSELDARVRQAVAEFKAGRREEARAILLEVVEEDERNEQAWLYLSALVESLEEQQICLENVLAINPANQKAAKGLSAIQAKITARRSRPAEPLAPFTPPPDIPPVAVGGGRQAGPAWDVGRPDAVPTFESGEPSPLPDWFASPPAVDSGWGRGARLPDGFAPPAWEPAPQQQPAGDQAAMATDALGLADAEAPVQRLASEDRAGVVAGVTEAAPTVSARDAAAAAEDYYSQIPLEIEAPQGGIGGRTLALLGGILLLVVLNAISFAYLLT